MNNRFLGYYNYTVILTYIGMLTGFLGIVCVMEDDIQTGLICLMAAGVCDMFDGAIAATRKRNTDEKCFGIQIDSLSDLICFGVLPAVILCRINENRELSYAVAALYVLSALIRLAYFNVDEQSRQKISEGNRKFYAGLPVTTIAIILPLFLVLSNLIGLKKSFTMTVTLAATGVLFLSPIKIKKPEIIGKVSLGICGMLEFIFLIAGIGDV